MEEERGTVITKLTQPGRSIKPRSSPVVKNHTQNLDILPKLDAPAPHRLHRIVQDSNLRLKPPAQPIGKPPQTLQRTRQHQPTQIRLSERSTNSHIQFPNLPYKIRLRYRAFSMGCDNLLGNLILDVSD